MLFDVERKSTDFLSTRESGVLRMTIMLITRPTPALCHTQRNFESVCVVGASAVFHRRDFLLEDVVFE